MEYEEIEKLSLEESKRQTKQRRDRGKNMIRPFTFDEEKILRDGLYHNNVKEKKTSKLSSLEKALSISIK
mgnify:CR=1 FL=1